MLRNFCISPSQWCGLHFIEILWVLLLEDFSQYGAVWNKVLNVFVPGLGMGCPEMVAIAAQGSAPLKQCEHYRVRKSITAHLLNEC